MGQRDDGRGSQHYDEDLVDRYLRHRHSPVTSPNLVMEEPAVRRTIGSVNGQRILDLGCGDGTFAGQCRTDGCAFYLGIDGSQPMIDRARAAATDPGIEFRHGDIEEFEPDAASFDLVIARMVLHYVNDLDRLLATVNHAISPGGRFVFTVVHPVVTAAVGAADGPRHSQLVERYFEPGRRQHRWFDTSVNWQHRTIEDYLNAVVAAGLTLDAFSECPPDESLFDGDTEEYRRRLQVPVFLLVGAGTGTGAGAAAGTGAGAAAGTGAPAR